MSLNIYYGGAGTGKSSAMMDDIKLRTEEGCSVCVIVPDQFTFEYERMLYDHLGCRLFNSGCMEVLSFSRLAGRISEFAAQHACRKQDVLPPADSAVKNAVMHLAIESISESEGFLHFGRQAKKPNFVKAALSMLAELICGGITPEVLADMTVRAPEAIRDKLSDISLIYTKYTELMTQKGFRDGLMSITDASEEAHDSGYFKGMHIFLDEFKSFTGDQYSLISVMLADCADMTVCLTTDSLTANAGTPFACISRTCGRLMNIAEKYDVRIDSRLFDTYYRFKAPELEHTARILFRPRPKAFEGNAGAITYASAPDLYSQCDWICAEIDRLVREGAHYSDIAVLSRAMGDSLPVLEAAFDRYDIPCYTDSKPSAAHKPLMLFISSALELASRKDLSTEALLRFLKTGLAGITDEETGELENYCYSWDIDGRMWRETFPDEHMELLRIKAVEPVDAFLKKTGGHNTPSDGASMCEALEQLLADTGVEAKLLEVIGKYTDAAAAAEMRDHERLVSQLADAFASLKHVLSGEMMTPKQFGEIFMLTAGDMSLASPPVSLDAVKAQQSDLARLSDTKIVFVMDANDGLLPFAGSDSSAFSDIDRDFFESEKHELIGGLQNKLAEEKFAAYKVLTSASEKLYIVYPCADPAGKPLYPSPAAERLRASVRSMRCIDIKDTDIMFYCTSEKAAYSALTDRYLRSDEGTEAVREVLGESEFYRSKLGYLDEVSKGTQSHHVHDRRVMRKLFGDTIRISASRFEDYSSCPFMYFCKSGLGIKPLQKNGLNPQNLGNVMHSSLYEIMRKYPKEEFLKMSASELRGIIKDLSDKYIKENLSDSFGKKKSFYFYLTLMEETLLISLEHIKRELMHSDFIPDEFELKIGGTEDSSPIIIDIDGETRLSFIGTADRVDIYTDNDGRKYIRILDYKTGKKDFDLTQLPYGINMQMFFYLFALTDAENGGKYAGFKPAGALYVPVHYPKLGDDRNGGTRFDDIADKDLKMKGIILSDRKIAEAMEKDLGGNYIPVKLKKDGTFDRHSMSHLAAESVINSINAYSKKLLKEFGRNIYAGNVPASPIETKSCHLPCSYCDYKDICGNYPDTKIRDISDIDPEMFMNNNAKESE